MPRAVLSCVQWKIAYTPFFGDWWTTLTAPERVSVDTIVRLWEERGPMLGRPYADTLRRSKHANTRELRIQHQGRPLRVLYAFDPRRTAVLLVGGDKTGDERWYVKHVAIADRLFDAHLAGLAREPRTEQ